VEQLKQTIDAFFQNYEERFNNALRHDTVDAEGTVASFSEYFIESSPVGVVCGQNNKEFRKRIEEGYAFYQSLGTQSMNILKKETTWLNEYHAMTRIGWRARMIRKDHSEVSIDFEVIYFTRLEKGEFKIFAYIAGDEQKAYKENGIEPYK
jgi:hypothetical protein